MTPAFPIDEALIVLASHPDDSRIELLLRTMEQHIRGEAGALVQYERLAQVSDPIVSLVMQLILEDEQRHHALLERIAATLRDALNWTRSADAFPSTMPTEGVAPELASLARTLIKEEQDGARALRELAARERGIDGGLDSALLEMMALDSEKHARLLQFVQRRLARASSA
jgi:rubrerythrin